MRRAWWSATRRHSKHMGPILGERGFAHAPLPYRACRGVSPCPDTQCLASHDLRSLRPAIALSQPLPLAVCPSLRDHRGCSASPAAGGVRADASLGFRAARFQTRELLPLMPHAPRVILSPSKTVFQSSTPEIVTTTSSAPASMGTRTVAPKAADQAADLNGTVQPQRAAR